MHTSIDTSFAVHPDNRSHAGVCATLGTGMFYCKSTAQKCPTSSCQSDLIALSKGLHGGLWTASFLEAQGYNREPVSVYQNNQSTIKYVENGRSDTELTRHIKIDYFRVHNLVKQGLVAVQYCHTPDMIADYFTQPLSRQSNGTLANYLTTRVTNSNSKLRFFHSKLASPLIYTLVWS